jgi:hypothetical protein
MYILLLQMCRTYTLLVTSLTVAVSSQLMFKRDYNQLMQTWSNNSSQLIVII